MDDVWFGQGATRADLETCLNALSLRDKDNTPLLAVTTGGAAPRLILASRALFGLFGVTTGEALSTRLLGGDDPGARRLGVLSQGLPLQGAPRLERLRFFMGPGTEIITFLCRRVPAPEGPLFIAAALGVRPGLMPAPAPEGVVAAPLSAAVSPQAEILSIEPSRFEPPVAAPMSVQTVENTLRSRWPNSRTLRFTWHSDADMVCTQVSPALAEAVGANGDLVGRNLLELAPRLDPTGKFAEALGKKATWSGLEIGWPIADAPAAVTVGLGAVPAFDRARAFEGYRGYGIVHLDRVSSHEPVRLTAAPVAPELTPVQAEAPRALVEQQTAPAAPNVVRFPNFKALSAEDEKTFVALGADLRQEAGIHEEPPAPAPAPVAPLTAAEKRAQDVGRHGLAVLDKLGLGLLVSRDNVPIFANRHLLDSLGFADEDALHDAGGMAHLFGDAPSATGGEPVGIRGRDGRIVPASARMQRIEWDGLPATLLTLQPPPAKAEALPAVAPVAALSVPTPPTNDAETRELRAILETATDGVAVIDGACNILSLNRSGEALLGCDRGTVVGKPFLDLFAAHNRSLASDYFDGLKSNATKRLLNDGRELLVNAAQGGTIPVFMTLGRVSGEDAPGGARFCALFRDLTHWKKVEQDLEAARHDAVRANDLKSDFLAKVSHEVRTPLNAIIGFAEVMMEERFGPVGNERYKDYLRDIHGSGTHVMSLVNDLLDLSKIEAGKMELAIDAIDANKIIGECVALMQPQASRERIIMRLSLAPSLPRIKADERSLRQIVLNILSNAVKFNEPGGQVIVATATTETGHMVIRIRDTGPGMSESDISAALEPFRQLATARPGVGGTGLGLPLTKALVEANQAAFSIRSKVDQGTLVEVAFPPARVLAA